MDTTSSSLEQTVVVLLLSFIFLFFIFLTIFSLIYIKWFLKVLCGVNKPLGEKYLPVQLLW